MYEYRLICIILTVVAVRLINGTYHATLRSIISQQIDNKTDKLASNCSCPLKGKIEDCTCSVDMVDQFNNLKLFPRLRSILNKDYFRFYKVNFQRKCPFWKDDGKCSLRTCHVKTCDQEDIPPGLRKNSSLEVLLMSKSHECGGESETDTELSLLNMTISPHVYKGFELWQAYDEDNFSHLPDEDVDAQYVDLLLNPERFTGYKGKAAHRIWKAIYLENCFWSPVSPMELNNLCLEKRVFYRIISGLHASINIHLSANYLFGRRSRGFMMQQTNEEWGRNPAEFRRRFSPENTNGKGTEWLKNLYFLFLVELRAADKLAPYLQNETFYTGNNEDDSETKTAVLDLLQIVNSFKHHFNESLLFDGGGQMADELKKEFRHRFRNVSQIMDCVGCQKCKLWGKLQVQGLGTALKILFSGKFDSIPNEIPANNDNSTKISNRGHQPKLARSEIVSLFNSIGRLSNSIYEIEQLKRMI